MSVVLNMICVLMVFLLCPSLSLHLLYNFMSVFLTSKRTYKRSHGTIE